MKPLFKIVVFTLMIAASQMANANAGIADSFTEGFSISDNVSSTVMEKSAGSRYSKGKHGWFSK